MSSTLWLALLIGTIVVATYPSPAAVQTVEERDDRCRPLRWRKITRTIVQEAASAPPSRSSRPPRAMRGSGAAQAPHPADGLHS
jgi:hypothetical protein